MEAYKYFIKAPEDFALIFLAQEIPEMDGITTCRAIREFELCIYNEHNVKIVIMADEDSSELK